jgi:hypothetical protein
MYARNVDKPPVSETEYRTTDLLRSSLLMRIAAGALLFLSVPLIPAIACAAWLGQSDPSSTPTSVYSTQQNVIVFSCFAIPYLCLTSWFAARELLPRPARPTSPAVKIAAAGLMIMVAVIFLLALLSWVIRLFFPRAYLDPGETPLGATLAELRLLLHPLLSGTLAVRALLPLERRAQVGVPIHTEDTPHDRG